MQCPKCNSVKTERSVKTWVCYDCMHVWMHREAQTSTPLCKCNNPATFLIREAGAWIQACKTCYMEQISKLDPTAEEPAYQLVEVNSKQMRQLLVDK